MKNTTKRRLKSDLNKRIWAVIAGCSAKLIDATYDEALSFQEFYKFDSNEEAIITTSDSARRIGSSGATMIINKLQEIYKPELKTKQKPKASKMKRTM